MIKKDPKMATEKKTETLEVRLPYSQKRAFMRACKNDGITASDSVRGFIANYLAHANQTSTQGLNTPLQEMSMTIKKHPRKTSATLASLAGLAMIFGATPSIANDKVFDRLDKNGDGVLSRDEFPQERGGEDALAILESLDADQDGIISPDEFTPKARVISITRETQMQDDDGNTVFVVEGKRTDFDLTDPERTKISIMKVASQYTEDGEMSLEKAVAEVREKLENEEIPEGLGADIRMSDDEEVIKKRQIIRKK